MMLASQLGFLKLMLVLFGQLQHQGSCMQLALPKNTTVSIEVDGKFKNATVVALLYRVQFSDGTYTIKDAQEVKVIDKPLVHPPSHPARTRLIFVLSATAVFALLTAGSLTAYEICRRTPKQQADAEGDEQLHDGVRGHKYDPDFAKRARKSLRKLLRAWLMVDTVAKRGARCSTGLVVLVFLAREWGWLTLTKVHAEVINSLSAVHESQDIDRVYRALSANLFWEFGMAIPVYWFFSPLLQRYWDIQLRSFLTKASLSAYINSGGQAYYRIKLGEVKNGIDNPDQRMTEDIDYICEKVYSIFSYILGTVFGLTMWSVVIAHVATWEACVIYMGASIIKSLFAFFGFGGALTEARQRVLMSSADLRYGLTRVRDSAEEVAFAKGDEREYSRVVGLFHEYVRMLWASMFVQVRFNVSLGLLGHFPKTLMWMMLAPRILNGDMGIGDAFRVFHAMDQANKLLEFLVDNFDSLTDLQANVNRLYQLLDACNKANNNDPFGFGDTVPNSEQIELANLEGAPPACSRRSLTADGSHEQPIGIMYLEAEQDIAVALKNVQMAPPDSGDAYLMGGATFACLRGQALLVVGPSGLGKTSLLRAVHGLWSTGSGSVSRPGGASNAFVMTLASRCYLPVGTLYDLICYPDRPEIHGCTEEDLKAAVALALHRARLAHLPEKWNWDDSRDWKPLLSNGEQQRVGFARLFLQIINVSKNCMLAILDEATGNLDVQTEAILYEEIRKELLNGGGLRGLVSVGHRPTLLPFHESTVVLGEITEEQKPLLDHASPIATGTWRTPAGKTLPWQHLKACREKRSHSKRLLGDA